MKHKQLVSLALALVLVCTILTVPVFADTATVGGVTYRYTVSNGEATITGYNGSEPTGSITLPSTIGGYPVTSIGYHAFEYCSGLTSVTIPDSVTSIGIGAFGYCSGLTAITVAPDNPAYSSEDGILFNKAKTKLIQCPGGKTGAYTIPDSVTSIGDWAFSGCSGLTSVTIPDSVTSIGYGAFPNCTGLTSVTIPDSVTEIGGGAFEYCSGLTSVTIPAGVTSIGEYAFFCCSGLTSVTIPAGVTSIGTSAFYGTAYYNNTANWENDVLYLGNYLITAKTTISGSYRLKEGTKVIADDAFFGCSGLTSVTIPAGVTSIGRCAFYGCSGLTSITISAGVTSIGLNAFQECSGLTDVYYGGTAEDWSKITIGDYNTPLLNATIHFYSVPEECEISDLVLKTPQEEVLQEIPKAPFLVSVPVTSTEGFGRVEVAIAAYDKDGTMLQIQHQSPYLKTGKTETVTAELDNSDGQIATLKAFVWDSFAGLCPLAAPASY